MVRILFLHPDLGIGGAERLVVDAALALKARGHEVSFLTNHHDPKHCFKETSDGTLQVQVVGDWLPRKIFGRFYALCAYLRMMYAALYASFVLSHRENIDVFFCDQISVGVPILKLAKRRPKIIFYCHFPDQLLSIREGYLKSVYRAPLNYLEEFTVGMADVTLVNSKFTLRVFGDTFQRLDVVPDVLYPSLNTQYFDAMQKKIAAMPSMEFGVKACEEIPRNAFIFLDINRYERKKNHALALHSFRLFIDALPASDSKRCRLIIAGGYDDRVVENVEHYNELRQIVSKLELQENVILLRSPNDDEKFMLLHKAHCLLYTPDNEHFGIVPLEGMYMSKPIIALNSGGPTETIVNNSTGFLCEQQPSKFADAMLQLYKDDALRERMGVMGHKRVQQKFSFEAFTDKLNNIVETVMKPVCTKESSKKKDA
ncbi:PREDICTED: alpha-1,3/1,6-mannosyltransferase ALG2 [Rhagoletis zephyria]|uniref:alpha-1,3/1,6-mannosyltransferase ALG2 n=1 Tax=Rhagoletis zephyria TaxID=28612 RepID=UPI000811A82F|nr:PREDICTED: alpha-1,3/1,6-mannosyltransferase ALG2 [Rhagoletis zephyria]